MLSTLNNIRNRVMRALTSGVGTSYSLQDKSIDVSQIKRVLIIRPNHKLGNQLLMTPLVQELESTFPICKIDLFSKGTVADIVFKNYSSIDKIYHLPRKPFSHLLKYAICWISIKGRAYDLVINGDKDSSSGKLLTKLSRSKIKFFGEIDSTIKEQYVDAQHISKYPIYNLRAFLKNLGVDNINKEMPLLDIKLSNKEVLKGKKQLFSLVNNNKKTICIYTNATGDKCLSEKWWQEFYNKLKETYSDNYNIIEMLPIENISKINFSAPYFYSKDIREMGGFLANTSIFIAADNGVMHLASASLITTIGLFSRGKEVVYEPYGNNSCSINVNTADIDSCISVINQKL